MIHFFGPDGSGKSTHVNILFNTLRKRDIKVKKCWVRSPHTLAFLLWRFLIKIGFCRIVLNPLGVAFEYPAVDRSKALKLIWTLIEFFSIIPLIIKIRIWIYRGYTLIAERYILDSVVTVAYFVNDIGFLNGRISRLFLYFIPKKTIFIFLDSDYQTIFRRRSGLLNVTNNNPQMRYGAVPKTAVEPKDFINFQRRAYKVLSKLFGALEINTSFYSIKETSAIILEYFRANKFHV